MKNKIVVFLVVAFVLVLIITVGANLFTSSSSQMVYKQPVVVPPTTNTTGGTKNTTPSYTLAEVQTHKDSSSCWSIVGANVYDLTSWINAHPGGPEAIMGICGVDGTAAFNAQHGGQKRPEAELANFLIGSYKK